MALVVNPSRSIAEREAETWNEDTSAGARSGVDDGMRTVLYRIERWVRYNTTLHSTEV
jgi:hypothetical protein